MTDNDFLEGARRTYTKAFAAWRTEKDKLDQTVASAIAAHQTIMSGNYWQPEWQARERLKVAEKILQILQP